MSNLRTTAQVIKALGGKHEVARLTGRSWSAVWNWEDRKAFPTNTYAVLKAKLETKGASAPDTLWGMASKEMAS
jgi:hypothetical protein